jgi:hypothetical protein
MMPRRVELSTHRVVSAAAWKTRALTAAHPRKTPKEKQLPEQYRARGTRAWQHSGSPTSFAGLGFMQGAAAELERR